jgi:hypothetical protein
MLPDCTAPSQKESDVFDFKLEVRPFLRSVSVRYWMKYGAMMRSSAIGGDKDIGDQKLHTMKVLRKPSTVLTIFLSAWDQALPSSLSR